MTTTLTRCALAFEQILRKREPAFLTLLYALCVLSAALALVDVFLIGAMVLIVLRMYMIRTGAGGARLRHAAFLCGRFRSRITGLLRPDTREVSPEPSETV